MFNIKDMSYEELKEQIKNCRELLDEYEYESGDYNMCKAELHVTERELKTRSKTQILYG